MSRDLRLTNFLLASIALLLLANLAMPFMTVVASAKEEQGDVAGALRNFANDGIKIKLTGPNGYENPTIRVEQVK